MSVNATSTDVLGARWRWERSSSRVQRIRLKPTDVAAMRLSGDEGVGLYEPPDVRPGSFARIDEELLNRLRVLKDVSATASDVLDELGWRLSVSVDDLPCRVAPNTTVVGQAVTLAYLPDRRTLAGVGIAGEPPKLAHHVIYRFAKPGDVMVIDGRGLGAISVLGGRAASAGVTSGLAAAIVDAGVRDLDTLEQLGFPIWARHVTPVTGKARAEAVSVNRPVCCGGVQVVPGDLVVADRTGICFVPLELVAEVVSRIIDVTAFETKELSKVTKARSNRRRIPS